MKTYDFACKGSDRPCTAHAEECERHGHMAISCECGYQEAPCWECEAEEKHGVCDVCNAVCYQLIQTDDGNYCSPECVAVDVGMPVCNGFGTKSHVADSVTIVHTDTGERLSFCDRCRDRLLADVTPSYVEEAE